MIEFIQSGGPIMGLLLAASVVSLAFIIERTVALRWQRVIPKAVEDAVEGCRTAEEAEALQRLCKWEDSPAARLLLLVINRRHWPKAENADALQTCARKEIAGLERGLAMIEVIVGVAPLLGLAGTLHGLIALFGDFSEASSGDNAVLAKGISIVLNTTLTGLLIAIPSLIAWSYFTRKVEALSIEMETLCDLLLQRFYAPESSRPAAGKIEDYQIQ